ncbi:MAG: hypothetical protein HQM16_06885 [Deltaproteobacteria bacterium]|nr:hypothetical protein [Deltaproteobacteria bacterium]
MLSIAQKSSPVFDELKFHLEGIKKQEQQDREILNLNAYDNRVSKTVLSLLSSNLSQRYDLGTPDTHGCSDPAGMGEFLFKGLPHLYKFEQAAITAASLMFGSVTSDFRPLSGMHGMICTLATLTEPDDVVYSVECDYGGHFATHHVLKRLGRRPESIPVDINSLSLDLEAFEKKVRRIPPRLVYLDVGCALYPLPIQDIRRIVGDETIIVYDASHTQGLIAGGVFQMPLAEGADILQGNTHKTFPGPQKAMVHFADYKIAKKLADSLTMGLVSSRHTHHSMALYVTLFEMLEFGGQYARQTLKNATALGKKLKSSGIGLLERDGICTQSNVLLINGKTVGGHVDACRRLYAANIATNSRHAFGKEVIRIGVQELTRRGMNELEMDVIGGFIKRVIVDKEDPFWIKREVMDFNSLFEDVHYSFDAALGY